MRVWWGFLLHVYLVCCLTQFDLSLQWREQEKRKDIGREVEEESISLQEKFLLLNPNIKVLIVGINLI